MKFYEKLQAITHKNNSMLCIGLDPDLSRFPHSISTAEDPIVEFNRRIISSTKDVVCAYKLNMAFYEALGWKGYKACEETIKLIPDNIVKIADAKRGDIDNSAKFYARAVFEHLKCDAVTVSPYLGSDSVEQFLQYEDKGTFVLCRTSNRGAVDFQDFGGNPPLYQAVAMKVKDWNTMNNCGLVVGATSPSELETVRRIVGDSIPILIPGVGAQGADLAQAVSAGRNSNGEMIIVNSSRSIIYASTAPDFDSASRQEAIRLKDEINRSLHIGQLNA